MGVNFMSRSSVDMGYRNTADPIPDNFTIVKMDTAHGHTLVHVQYPNCTNYEGNKFILFKDTTPKEVYAMSEIDPHFRKSSNIIARLEPTATGWGLGFTMMHNMGTTL